MAHFDLPLDQLRMYKPERNEPADFDAFWQQTLAETALTPLAPKFESVDVGLRHMQNFDVSFHGFGGQMVKAWLNLPAQRNGPLPVVVEYLGYGGGRGFPTMHTLWPSVGVAHLLMDTRGQGSAWSKGDTSDVGAGGSPAVPGYMTQGITDPKRYYYRRVMTDAARAIAAARSHAAIDASRVAVTGGSQGGGLALAAAGLVPDVQLCIPDVPFLCNFRRAATLVDTMPYKEIGAWCNTHMDKVALAFNTLGYFDGMNFAARARARALFSVGLMDQVTPPSTCFAAYNHYAGQKDIKVYEFNGHEGGREFHTIEKVKFVRAQWG